MFLIILLLGAAALGLTLTLIMRKVKQFPSGEELQRRGLRDAAPWQQDDSPAPDCNTPLCAPQPRRTGDPVIVTRRLPGEPVDQYRAERRRSCRQIKAHLAGRLVYHSGQYMESRDPLTGRLLEARVIRNPAPRARAGLEPLEYKPEKNVRAWKQP